MGEIALEECRGLHCSQLCAWKREFCSRFWNHCRSRPRRPAGLLDFEDEHEDDEHDVSDINGQSPWLFETNRSPSPGLWLIDRPAARGHQFDQVMIRISEVNTLSTPWPVDSAFNGNVLLL